MSPDCFACHPGPSNESDLRALCMSHERSCRLADGALLQETLELATPPEGPLEGSLLAWLYNPVFVIDRDGTRQRGWADFAGGGLAVLEDRFASRNAFEFWMCESTNGIELLAT